MVFKDVSSMRDAVNLVFNQDTTLAEVIRIFIYILTILSILGTIYCFYPKFRLWFNGCCFITKPTKYWRDVKGYKVPDFISRQRQLEAANTFIEMERVDNNIATVTAPVPENNKEHENNQTPEAPIEEIVRAHTPIFMPPPMPPMSASNSPNLRRPHPFNRISRLYSPLLLSQMRRQ
jgi:hypothetical protein